MYFNDSLDTFHSDDLEKYKQNDKPSNIECSICLNNIDSSHYKLGCDHCFHINCINEWYKRQHNDCPLCRADINSEQSTDITEQVYLFEIII